MFDEVIVTNAGASKETTLDFSVKCNKELYTALDRENRQDTTVSNKEIAHKLRVIQTRILGLRCSRHSTQIELRPYEISSNKKGKMRWNKLRIKEPETLQTWIKEVGPKQDENFLFWSGTDGLQGVIGIGFFNNNNSLELLSSVSVGEQVVYPLFDYSQGSIIVALQDPVGNQIMYDKFIERYIHIYKKMENSYRNAELCLQKSGNAAFEVHYKNLRCLYGESAIINLIANENVKRDSDQVLLRFPGLNNLERMVGPLYREYQDGTYFSFEIKETISETAYSTMVKVVEDLLQSGNSDGKLVNMRLADSKNSDEPLTFIIEIKQ
jgi:hypothetical protein